ncbi:transmembrane protein, putative (macronuclear) [Tetrahymena thermophila SB210]|uniref:Transmembrane protein, putative n=1 Tax=Tetrahymena thermophila (strain SB210) TaxID=312017 RepID=Q236V6_TETTS|nr:transmembrane protein, putative [Tetrahymena thermophila SB210]EAR92394.2 transmembrane protein, putative [Tetrahymena thermophila SB210]|eukprot:XP_001012639.2 transmembrane protein, putative [Tetrahymena thermophila SB210]
MNKEEIETKEELDKKNQIENKEEIEQKDPSPVEVTTKEPNTYQKYRFYIVQLQCLLVAIITTGLMQLSNHLAIYLIYCCPMYFFIVLVQYTCCWYQVYRFTFFFELCSLIVFVVCLPVFFGVFFGCFHPTASVELVQAQNCQMIGQLSNFIENTEKYSILYINFEFEGQKYLGQACASNFHDSHIFNEAPAYYFYSKYEGIKCGSSDGNRTDPQYPYSRLLSQNNFNQTELESKKRFLARVSSTPGCLRDYTWSQVKIASWLCQSRGYDVEKLMEPQSCYVNFYKGRKAVENGIQRSPMRDSSNFPLITYQPHAYYPVSDLVCLIVFTYYSWILSLSCIFNRTNKCIRRKIKKRNELAIPVLEQKLDPQSVQQIQLEQQNKEMLNTMPNVNQIHQENINFKITKNVEDIQEQQQISNPMNQYEKRCHFLSDLNQVPVLPLGSDESKDDVVKNTQKKDSQQKYPFL